MKTQRSTTRIAASIAVGILVAVGLGPSATAGSSTIDCVGTLRPISNANTGSTSWASTNSNGNCGNVGLASKVYVGGGVYSWQSAVYYGSSSGVKTRSNSATLSHSRHYYAYYGNPTSKDISV